DINLILILSFIFLLVCFFLINRGSNLRLPPGPRGYPLLGALPLIGPAPHVGLAKLAKRYGPIMYLKMGACSVVVASTPSSARAFLTAFDAQYANRPNNVISGKDITYNGNNMVFANYTPRYKLLRKLSTLHMLSNKALTDWAPVRRSEVSHMVRTMLESSSRNELVVVPETLICATANIIGQVMLNRRVFDVSGSDLSEFKVALKDLMTGGGLFNVGDFVPSIAWMDLQGIQAKMKRVHERLDEMIKRLLDEHKATTAERQCSPDFIDLVMASKLRDDDGEKLSDVNIRALISDMFTAGSDTSSVIVEWAISEMLKNQIILKRLQSELDTIIGRERMLEESDIPNLPYLQAVCKEALRLHPSTPLSLPHFSTQPCEVNGYHIPANTRLLVNVWAIGRDPDTWERPLEFYPERFLPGGKATNIEPHGTDFELIPFGAGRRICAGKQAGIIFVQYFLGVLMHAFDWQLPAGEKIDMKESYGLVVPKAVPLKAMVLPRLAPCAYI
ncbi:flavonoid 3'5'-hydroxylase protein, partial [Dioscorea alata]